MNRLQSRLKRHHNCGGAILVGRDCYGAYYYCNKCGQTVCANCGNEFDLSATATESNPAKCEDCEKSKN